MMRVDVKYVWKKCLLYADDNEYDGCRKYSGDIKQEKEKCNSLLVIIHPLLPVHFPLELD